MFPFPPGAGISRKAEYMKRRLRHFLVWSSVPPFIWVYRGIYRFLAWSAITIVRRHRGVVAIYLSRGIAKNEINPGISDIDIFIVTADDGPDRTAVQRTLNLLAIVTGKLIDYNPTLVTSLENLNYRWENSPVWRYRYREGKITWKLVHGKDVLENLPEVDEALMPSSCWAEMNHWWVRFADFLLKPGGYYRDKLMRNVTCYKAVSEVANARHALETGEYIYSRPAGLERSGSPLAAKLKLLAGGRYLARDDKLAEETYRFLVDAFQSAWEGFRGKPFFQVCPDARQEVDCPESELGLSEEDSAYLDGLRQYLEDNWKEKFIGIQPVRSAFWEMNEILLIVQGDEANIPELNRLLDLTEFHFRNGPRSYRRLPLFLRHGNLAFPLTPEIPADLHRGVLTPATFPDVFLQLGENNVFWTSYTQWYLADWRENERWPGASALKRKQLEIIGRSARDGDIRYPLTEAAIKRKEEDISNSNSKLSLIDQKINRQTYPPGVEFSVKRIISGNETPAEKLYQCLVEARRFLDEVSADEIMQSMFAGRENRYRVLESVRGDFHVGFIFPARETGRGEIKAIANQAGFKGDHVFIESKVVSRELGHLSSVSEVRTEIFFAKTGQARGESGYAEVFLPAVKDVQVASWMDEEVGTHVGFTMRDPDRFGCVSRAFEDEGFYFPKFMGGATILVSERDLEIAYYEKMTGRGTFRVEVLNFLNGGG